METNSSLTIVRANIVLEAQAHNLQKLLQEGENIVITKENINDTFPAFDALIATEKKLAALENPHTKAWQEWNAAFKGVNDPIKELVKRIRTNKGIVAKKIQDDQNKINNENKRINDIKTLIQNKSIEFSQSIASATTNEELVRIEKLIGSEKARRNVYAEFLPNLIIELDNLTPLTKAQKGNVKELENLSVAIKTAQENEDDAKFLELAVQEEALLEKIEQNKTEVQHVALSSAMKVEEVEAVNTTVAPKARRQTWEFEIYDFALFKKYYPEYVKCEADNLAIKEFIRLKKESKEIKEQNMFGLRIYLKSIY